MWLNKVTPRKQFALAQLIVLLGICFICWLAKIPSGTFHLNTTWSWHQLTPLVSVAVSFGLLMISQALLRLSWVCKTTLFIIVTISIGSVLGVFAFLGGLCVLASLFVFPLGGIATICLLVILHKKKILCPLSI